MSSILRIAAKVNHFLPVEVYPLVGIVSVACGFGVYTSVLNTKKNSRSVQSVSQPRFAEYPALGAPKSH